MSSQRQINWLPYKDTAVATLCIRKSSIKLIVYNDDGIILKIDPGDPTQFDPAVNIAITCHVGYSTYCSNFPIIIAPHGYCWFVGSRMSSLPAHNRYTVSFPWPSIGDRNYIAKQLIG